jgi:hypothetical protein
MRILSAFLFKALAVATLLTTPSLARADLVWSWSFDQTQYTVSPSDSIVVRATLRNDPSSTADLGPIEGVNAIFAGDLQKTYNFTFGPTGNSTGFGIDLLGLDLAPGQSAPFVYGILTPIGGAAPPGVYPADPATLGLELSGQVFLPEQSSTNTFTVRVVPEPPGLLLLCVGLAFLGVFHKSRGGMGGGWTS